MSLELEERKTLVNLEFEKASSIMSRQESSPHKTANYSLVLNPYVKHLTIQPPIPYPKTH